MRKGLLLVSLLLATPSFSVAELPYAQAGLTPREAARHLLSRFTFGPRSGEVDAVLHMGLATWFEEQLAAALPDTDLQAKLTRLTTLELDNEEIASRYPNPGRVLAMAGLDRSELQEMEAAERRERVADAYASMGFGRQRELLGQLVAARVFRAAESPNQLQEVLVDFWSNHLYVTATDNQARRFVGTYERDVIRPHALGRFGPMLEASAKHPAMLLYLDNAQSSAGEEAPTLAPMGRRKAGGRRGPGINENYARELLELHTLGVDGGYTQTDVEEAARILTGWTLLPEGERRQRVLDRMERQGGERFGFAVQGDFFFHAGWHDAAAKRVLGHSFPAGGGLEEGLRLLELLGEHPSTARHLSRKIAVRFVSDDPPPELVDRLAAGFLDSGGDTQMMLRILVESPEFWRSRGAKIKSPFELAVSAVRALDGTVHKPGPLVRWIEMMGQPLYRYRAPTGFPDRAPAWIGPGTLVERMNFVTAVSTGKIRGVRIRKRGAESSDPLQDPEFQNR